MITKWDISFAVGHIKGTAKKQGTSQSWTIEISNRVSIYFYGDVKAMMGKVVQLIDTKRKIVFSDNLA